MLQISAFTTINAISTNPTRIIAISTLRINSFLEKSNSDKSSAMVDYRVLQRYIAHPINKKRITILEMDEILLDSTCANRFAKPNLL